MDINSLRILLHKRMSNGAVGILPITPNTYPTEFFCVAAAITLAVDLLRSQQSIRALRSYTRGMAEEIAQLKSVEGQRQVDEFLTSVQNCIPTIIVTKENGMLDKNGRTNKVDCERDFIPRKAGLIELNELLIQALARTCQRVQARGQRADLVRFRTLLCRIAVTFAHELVHMYTLCLRRFARLHTPPRLTYGYGDQMRGEAGRFWEYMVFGGFMDMRVRDGLEAMAVRDNQKRYAWRLKTEFIERLVSRQFSWLEDVTAGDYDYRKEAVERMDTYRWTEKYSNFFPPTPNAGLQELHPTEVQRIMNLDIRQFPVYRVRVADLRNFAQDPRLQVQVQQLQAF